MPRPGFFPFELHDDDSGPQTVVYNRHHVVTVALADAEARRDPGYKVARQRFVSVLLSNGARLSGSVRVYRPEGRDRLSDWARQAEVRRGVFESRRQNGFRSTAETRRSRCPSASPAGGSLTT